MVASYRIEPGTTPEQVRRRRELAEALLLQGMKPREIEHWTQGGAQLMQALVGGMGVHRANQEEAALTKASAAREAAAISALLGGQAGGQPSPLPPPAPTVAADPMTARRVAGAYPGAQPPVMDPDTDVAVRTVMGEAGGGPLDEQAAVASVLLNRSKERGQPLAAVAKAPHQFEPWGARRAELEGYDPQSPEYIKTARLVQALQSGAIPDPTGGADHFYAPKLQADLGRSTPAWAQGPGQDIGRQRFFNLEGEKPAAPVRVAQNRQVLMDALVDPNVSDTAKKAILKKLEGPEYRPLTPEEEALYPGFKGGYMTDKGPKAPPKGTTVNVDTGKYGPLEPGTKLQKNPDGSEQIVPIPGGKAARESEEAAKKEGAIEEGKKISAAIVMDDIRRAIETIDANPNLATGLGSLTSNIPLTPSYKLDSFLTTIKSNIGFDKLQQMRAASPTGAALGPVSDFENQLLQATFGSVKPGLDPETLKYNLRRVDAIYNQIIHKGIKTLDDIPDIGPPPAPKTEKAVTRRKWNPETGQLEPVQ